MTQAQVVEYLPSKYEALSLNSSITKKKKERGGGKGGRERPPMFMDWHT
jgi:hypothetical protein